MATIKRLGDLLLEKGLVKEEDITKALTYQKEHRVRLGKAFIQVGAITEEVLNKTLSEQYKIPLIDLAGVKLNIPLVKSIPEVLIREHKFIPLSEEGNKLHIAVSDPLNYGLVDDVEGLTGRKVTRSLAYESEVERAISSVFDAKKTDKVIAAIEQMGKKAAASNPLADNFFDLDTKNLKVDDAPIIQLINNIFLKAISEKISDIHISASENEVFVRYRLDGILRKEMGLPKDAHPAIVSRIKVMSKMDIGEKRIPQDGRIQVKLGDILMDMRVSTLPSIFGENISIRILDKSNLKSNLDDVGFHPKILEQYKNLIYSSTGIILVTGPTGSGKSSTLYTSISTINDISKNIITVEDPVEYVLDGIIQVQANHRAGLDFPTALKSILRQDPDVILIGEIRDVETAKIAVKAANTGHLVFSTLHTNDAASAITRLVDMDIEPYLVASSVIGVVGQRLVRRICKDCKVAVRSKGQSKERAFFEIPPDKELKLFKGKGCPSCKGTGYKGRVPVQELLVIDDEIRDLILKKATASQIQKEALLHGMITFKKDGLSKALQGLTTLEEVKRVIG